MAYNTIGFKDGSTPLNATNMNKMDEQIKANADDISTLNTDLGNEHQIRTLTSLSDLGLSSGVSSLDVLNAMRNQGYTNTFLKLMATNDSVISDTPTGSGVFTFYVAGNTSQRYGSLEYICNSGSTTPRYFIGHITSGFEGVNWFEVGLTQINSLTLPLPEED